MALPDVGAAAGGRRTRAMPPISSWFTATLRTGFLIPGPAAAFGYPDRISAWKNCCPASLSFSAMIWERSPGRKGRGRFRLVAGC